MKNKVTFLLLAFTIALVSCKNDLHAGSQPFLVDNMSYDIQITEKLSKNAVKNLNYKIVSIGNALEPNFNENAQYELVKFDNGKYEPQFAEIQKIAFDTNKDSSIKSYSFYMIVSNGINGYFTYIVIVNPIDEKSLHINQALIDYPHIVLKNIQYQNNKIAIDSRLHKSGDPDCCPTAKVPLTFVVKDDRIVCNIKNIKF